MTPIPRRLLSASDARRACGRGAGAGGALTTGGGAGRDAAMNGASPFSSTYADASIRSFSRYALCRNSDATHGSSGTLASPTHSAPATVSGDPPVAADSRTGIARRGGTGTSCLYGFPAGGCPPGDS
ncbi:hypothetical protein [Actinophytocola sp. KF-1]